MLNKQSFTLVELLITMVVSALVINGVIMSLVNSMVLNEFNKGFSVAINIARAKTEEVIGKRSNFASIVFEDGPLSLTTDGIDGRYRIDVETVPATDPNSPLKNVRVSVCWRARGGRIIGECTVPAGSSLQWKSLSPAPTSCTPSTINKPYSPCCIETAVSAR